MNLDETLPIEVTRGAMIESVHAVDVCIADAEGNIVLRRGDWDRVIYARSSAKPLQALPLIETGAAQHFGLDDTRIALACGSHTGEPVHTETIAAWLGDIGLDENSLECGPHRPTDRGTDDKRIESGAPFSRIHNNCSGKHAGFLSTAVHLGEQVAGYIGAAHPVQQRVIQVLKEMSGENLTDAPRGEDGCGIPVVGMCIGSWARAMAQLADPRFQGAVRGAACGRIVAAMTMEPYLVAGRNRLDAALMGATEGIATKAGAEGVHTAIMLARKIGIAVKARCGSQRAADAGILWALRQVDAISATAMDELAGWIEQPIDNTLGSIVGSVRVGH